MHTCHYYNNYHYTTIIVLGFFNVTTHDLSLNWRVSAPANTKYLLLPFFSHFQRTMYAQTTKLLSECWFFISLTNKSCDMHVQTLLFILSYLHYFGKFFSKTTWSKSSPILCAYKQRRNTVHFLFFGAFCRHLSY